MSEQVLQFGLEETYGLDPELEATKAFRAYNVQLTPFAGSTADRARAGVGSGAYPVAHLGTYQTLMFDVDLAGAGAAGTEPLWGAAAECCNLAKVVTANTSVTYSTQNFVDATAKSGTAYFLWNGIKHKITGARGEPSLIYQPGSIPVLRFAMTGLFNPAADAEFPDVEATVASWVEGVEFNPDNSTFSLFGATPELQSAQFNLGNQVKYTPRVNAKQVRIPGMRQGGGNLSFKMQSVAAKDWLGIAKANTLGAAQIVHGKTAGNIVQFDAGKLQIVQPTLSDTDDETYLSSQIRITRNPGGVEFKITVK
jgi:hypothetical protein